MDNKCLNIYSSLLFLLHLLSSTLNYFTMFIKQWQNKGNAYHKCHQFLDSILSVIHLFLVWFQNFLNNMAADDVMTFVAHIMLYFQMTCVFPLLTFVFRVQLLSALFGSEWPRWVQPVLWISLSEHGHYCVLTHLAPDRRSPLALLPYRATPDRPVAAS